VSYKIAGRGKPGSCGLVADAAAHKSFMARLLRGLIAAGVEGIGYYPSLSADRSLSSPLETAAGAIPHLFTYLDYTSEAKLFRDSDEFEEFGWQDPLKDVQFTLEDYQEVGISRDSLETIRRGQTEYLKGHFAGALTTMKRRLESLENEPADPTGGVVDQHVGEALARFAASDFAGGSYGDERLMAIASKNPDEFLAICRGFEHLAHEARIARDQFGLDLNAQMAAGQFEVSASENLIKV
jgi:hypothetical protein